MPEERKRIVNDTIDTDIRTFGGVLIEGPRGCGKSFTAKSKAKSVLDFRDEKMRDEYVKTGKNNPERLLRGENPRLITEWQSCPEIWDTARHLIDERNEVGLYIFTGRSSDGQKILHNGFGRITSVNMWPMSLYESGESSGESSLCEIIDNPESFKACRSELSQDAIIDAICRGGWPECVCNPDDAASYVENMYEQICDTDIRDICGGRKNSDTSREIVRYYAENIGLTTRDILSLGARSDVSFPTLSKCISALKDLYVIEDIPAWPYLIYSETHRVMSQVHNVADPSLAVCALGLKKEDLYTNYSLYSRMYKCLCYRDLKVYSEARGGKLYFYRDRNNTHVDCVLDMGYGKYALIELKPGRDEIEDGVKNLCKVEKRITAYNDKEGNTAIALPSAKILITGTEYGYRYSDNTFVVPVGCLKN